MLLGSVLSAIEALLIVFLYSNWSHEGSWVGLVQNHSVAFYAALFLPVLPFLYRRALDHQRTLLEQGEVAIATVKSRYRKNRTGPFYVKYSFRDLGGNIVEGESLDSTSLLREGSGMLVFYDSDKVEDQIAECAAYYEVMMLGMD